MTKLRKDFVFDDKTGWLVLSDRKDMVSKLGAMQAHHSIGTRKMQCAQYSYTMKDILKAY